jgi:hypothetical protein
MLDDYNFFARLAQVRPDAPHSFDDTVRGYFIYNAELLLQKHRDYGPSNIADAPGGPINGLRVRMHDKMARINHLVDNNQEAVNEPLRDSFMDLANYAMIGLLVLDGKWPKK